MEKCFYCFIATSNVCPSCQIISYCSKEHLNIHRSKSGECFPFKIDFKDSFGKFCVAIKDIKPFEVILEDTATAWGTYDDSKPLCLSCLKIADLNIKCEFCNLPMCGSKECINSSVHIPECEILRRHQPNKLDIQGNHVVYALIAPLRIFQKKYSSLESDVKAFEQIMKLESHIDELQKGLLNDCILIMKNLLQSN